MKRILATVLAAMMLATTANAVELYIDFTKLDPPMPPVIVDGSTLVPMRAIFEALGADVEWDAETRTAKGTRGDTVVEIPIDSRTAYVNGESKELAVPAQLINNSTMVPARFVSESMGCVVTWNGETSTAAVADKLRGLKFYAAKPGKHYHFSETCNGGTYYEATLAEVMGRHLSPCDKCVLPTSVSATLETIDGLDGLAFEYWSAELLRQLGCTEVEVTKASGDQGVDILAQSGGVTYAIQCKRYASNLNNSSVQEVYAGKQMYQRDVGAVITNQYFTDSAKELAESTGILLWDRDWIAYKLLAMEAAGMSLSFDYEPATTSTVERSTSEQKSEIAAPLTIRGRDANTTVYVSARSNTIHSVHDCSGMKNYRTMTLGEADSRGYRYCPNCW